MGSVSNLRGQGYIDKPDLLAALAADLRLPFLQIKTKLELLSKSDELSSQNYETLSLSAETGLRLLDAYLRTLNTPGAIAMQLEPVSPWQLLEDSAGDVAAVAKAYNTEIIIDLKACGMPVMADKKATRLALACLAESYIKAQVGHSDNKFGLLLGGHRRPGGAVLGVYGMLDVLSASALERARLVAGKTHQPFSSLATGIASGIIIADQLLAETDSPLTTSSHNRLKGLGAFFPAALQLKLV